MEQNACFHGKAEKVTTKKKKNTCPFLSSLLLLAQRSSSIIFQLYNFQNVFCPLFYSVKGMSTAKKALM